MVTAPTLPAIVAESRLAWFIAAGYFTLAMVIFVSFALVAPAIAETLALSEAQLGLLGGAMFAAYAVGQFVLGMLLGRFPPHRILTPSAVLAAAGCIGFSFADSFVIALTAGVLLQLGLGSASVGMLHIATRDLPTRFAFFSALGQAMATTGAAAITLLDARLPLFEGFRTPYLGFGVLLLGAAAILSQVDRRHPFQARHTAMPGLPDNPTFRGTVTACLPLRQFWLALVFYGFLYAALIAYSRLWNTQFQMRFFGHGENESAMFNATILVGIAIGSVAAGAWAQWRDDPVLPARVFALLAAAAFVVMFAAPLPAPAAMALNFVIGFAAAGSVLGFAAMRAHVPQAAFATATAIFVTTSVLLGGIVDPLVGLSAENPVSGELIHLAGTDSSRFGTYQSAMLWFIGCAAISCVASLWLSNPQRQAIRR